MSYVTIESKKIITGYHNFLRYRDEKIKERKEKAIDDYISKHEEMRKKWYNLFMKPISRAEATHRLHNNGLFDTTVNSTFDLIESVWREQSKIFADLYIAANRANVVHVDVDDLSHVSMWIGKVE